MEENTHISYLMDSFREAKANRQSTLELGFNEVDELFQGGMPGELVTILGDCGSGKTSLTIRIVDRLSVDKRIPTLYLCCRETPEGIISRLVNFRCPEDASEKEREDVIKEISEAPIYLYSRYYMNIDDICNVCRNHVIKYGVKTVYVHFMYVAYNRENAYRLRMLAKELEITIVLLVSVIDCIEGFEGRQPKMSDLYECNLNEYSETVIGLCNYALYDVNFDLEGIDIRNLLHISILKCHGELMDRKFYVSKDAIKYKNRNAQTQQIVYPL